MYFHQSVKLTWSATDTKAPQNVTDWLDIGRLLAGINIRLNPTVAVLCGQNIVMLLNRIIFESQWVSSFEIQYEGFGYPSTVGYALYPFIVTLSAKYAYDFGLIVPAWQLVVSSITFLIGFGIFTKSNRIKDAFRKNPYDVKLKGKNENPIRFALIFNFCLFLFRFRDNAYVAGKEVDCFGPLGHHPAS